MLRSTRAATLAAVLSLHALVAAWTISLRAATSSPPAPAEDLPPAVPVDVPRRAGAPTVESDDDGSCPALAGLESRVDLLLSQSPIERPDVEVRAEMRQRRDGFVLRLTLESPTRADDVENAPDLGSESPSRERHELRGPQCEALVEAGALIVAYSVDPVVLDHFRSATPTAAPRVDAPTEASDPKPVPDAELLPESGADATATEAGPRSETEAARASSSDPEPAAAANTPRSTPDAPNDHALRFGLRSTLGCCVTPALNFGGGGNIAWVFRPRGVLEFGARHLFRRDATVEGGRGAIGVSDPAGFVRLCVRGAPVVEWVACLGGEAGALVGTARDDVALARRAVAWGAVTAMGGIRWPAEGRVALAIDLEGWAALDRFKFKFDGISGAYRASAVGLRGTLGADLRFGGPVTRKTRKAATKS